MPVTTSQRIGLWLLVCLVVWPMVSPAAGRILRVGEIAITTRPIFSEQEVAEAPLPLYLMRRAMNALHVDTRQSVLRRELLFAPGDLYEPSLLAETERNLRSLGIMNNVRVTAVDTTADGRVNVRITGRESWTLQTSVAYSRASSGDQRWNVQLSESNFLGRALTLGLGIGADENAAFWNGWYRQRRLLGTAFVLGIDYAQRDNGHFRSAYLSRPFFAQDDRWGLDLLAWDNALDVRYYLSNAGSAGTDSARPASLYTTLPYREKLFEARFLIRASGVDRGRIWRFGGGLRLLDRDFARNEPLYEISDGRYLDLDWLFAPGTVLDRAVGLQVLPYVWLQTSGRRWVRTSFARQYGPDEDLSLAWEVDLKIGVTGRATGSSTGTSPDGYGSPLHVEGRAARWYEVPGGFLVVTVEGEAERGGAYDYHRLDGQCGWVGQNGPIDAPWLTRLFVEAAHGDRLLGTHVFRLGLDRGLRSLDYDGLAGERLLRWNLEQGKVLPGELLGLFRLGLAAFYSGGQARFADEERDLSDAQHEFGCGLRLGPTRSANSQITRLDVTWNTDGSGPVFTATTRGFF